MTITTYARVGVSHRHGRSRLITAAVLRGARQPLVPTTLPWFDSYCCSIHGFKMERRTGEAHQHAGTLICPSPSQIVLGAIAEFVARFVTSLHRLSLRLKAFKELLSTELAFDNNVMKGEACIGCLSAQEEQGRKTQGCSTARARVDAVLSPRASIFGEKAVGLRCRMRAAAAARSSAWAVLLKQLLHLHCAEHSLPVLKQSQ